MAYIHRRKRRWAGEVGSYSGKFENILANLKRGFFFEITLILKGGNFREDLFIWKTLYTFGNILF